MSKETTKSITIIGRKWFQKSYGNTYHTAQIMVNGVTVHKTKRHYGYEDQYVETATEWLEKNSYIPKRERKNGGHKTLWRICKDDLNIPFEYYAIAVNRQKDL